jgi:anti-sigma factor RsiW
MNCAEVRRLLALYCDGELDLMQHVGIEEHLRECVECAEQAENLRSLRAVFESPALYQRAPASLRARVLAELEVEPSAWREQISPRLPASAWDGDAGANDLRPVVPMTQRAKRWTLPQLAAIAAGITLLAGTSATVGVMASRSRLSTDNQLADWIVSGHVRSLQADHLMDVASSDRHTVKPWFKGKVEFSPQTPDLAADGFELTGGRLDYLQDRPVAAIVYSRRKHTINLFTWPTKGDALNDARSVAKDGFNLRHWQQGGMEYWAISDLNDEELGEFVKLYQERSEDGGSGLLR